MEETEGCKTRRSGSHVESKLLCPAPLPCASRGAGGCGWAMGMGHVHLIT